ncbi:hypothetical protein K501DRAFT_236455 [Backusella circina FSU 941]|nr:hypothetical protein K501DRAFT_236455 [Backusella circina FSU 941]
MWRSWVDRINTINNKIPEESGLSKEEAAKREEHQTRLREIWQRTNDLLSTEEDRSHLFQTELLPLVGDAYTLWGADFAFSSLPDDRAFIQHLSEELVNGIRRASENKDKIEASQGVMDLLRSHLYNVIQMIQYATHASDTIMTYLIQQRIPQLVVKMMGIFIHLAPEYYQHFTADVQVKSISDVGDITADILRNLVQNQNVLHRLLMDDTLMMMIKLLRIQPDDINRSIEPTYIIWKYR